MEVEDSGYYSESGGNCRRSIDKINTKLTGWGVEYIVHNMGDKNITENLKEQSPWGTNKIHFLCVPRTKKRDWLSVQQDSDLKTNTTNWQEAMKPLRY